MINPQYLGDGVYVHDNGYGLTLTTGHHEPEKADSIVILEPEIVNRFLDYLKANCPNLFPE